MRWRGWRARPAEAMAAENSSIVGVGLCPEGIEQNPVVYDLMTEWAFRFVPAPHSLGKAPCSMQILSVSGLAKIWHGTLFCPSFLVLLPHELPSCIPALTAESKGFCAGMATALRELRAS